MVDRWTVQVTSPPKNVSLNSGDGKSPAMENRFPRKANNTKGPKSIFFPRLLFPELSKLSVFGYVK